MTKPNTFDQAYQILFNLGLFIFLSSGLWPVDILQQLQYAHDHPHTVVLVADKNWEATPHQQEVPYLNRRSSEVEPIAVIHVQEILSMKSNAEIIVISIKDVLHEKLSINPITNRFIPPYEASSEKECNYLTSYMNMLIQTEAQKLGATNFDYKCSQVQYSTHLVLHAEIKLYSK